MVFSSAGELYALPLQAVREVIAAAPRRTLPSPPEPWVVGMASIRGDLMPVVDLSARMGGAPIAPDAGVLLVVEGRRTAKAEPQRAAVAVDHVDRLAEPEQIVDAPAYAGEAAAGLFERDGQLVMVLSPAALLPDAGTAARRRPRAPRSRPA